MSPLDIELTPQEMELFYQINFCWDRHDPAAFKKNGDAVVALMKSLLTRKAIPDIRLKYFTDPEYQSAQTKGSYRDLFRQNGNTDDEMMRQADFLPFLYYFVCGPKLPAEVMRRFRQEVTACGNVTSGDVIPLSKFAKAEVRAGGFAPREAAEEYFRLALDCGMEVDYAYHVRDEVKSIR